MQETGRLDNRLDVPEACVGSISKGYLESAKRKKGREWHAIVNEKHFRKGGMYFMGSFPCIHTSIQTKPIDPSVLIALLPLFYEKAASIAMVKHGMDIQ